MDAINKDGEYDFNFINTHSQLKDFIDDFGVLY